MDYSTIPVDDLDHLSHHGILGQKWGIRRYQNPDGSLTAAGKRRYAKTLSLKSNKEKVTNEFKSQIKSVSNNKELKESIDNYKKTLKAIDDYEQSEEHKKYMSNVYNKAYKKAMESMQEYDPDAYEKMIMDNGGSTKNLQDYPLFDTYLDGSLDYIYDQYPDEHMDKLYDDWTMASKEYRKQCDITTNEIVGKYGNLELKAIPKNANGYYTLSDLVDETIEEMYKPFAN